MTTWRDQLQPASFRGVRFEVDSDRSPVGRRTQTHEFVQRDQPFVEDLGRQTREYKFAAFVIGADCYAKRDALLAALDQPGPGELVHPHFGKLNVTAADCSVSHERREGGLVRFDLAFVEAGEKGFPVGTANTGRQLLKAKGGLLDLAGDKFLAAMGLVNAGRAKMSALQNALAVPFSIAQGYFGEAMRGVGSVSAFADLLVSSPAAFLGLFSSLSGGASGLASSFTGYGAAVQALPDKASAAAGLSSSYAYTGDST
ncbi:DNA circularization N-terminal domain-containing protein, partial [Pseudomonas sp. GD04158]|uniref:DNA circularization protein n=1 Tax=Pseudomonas sp. GD04158 TaxID=2975439 RepID=UPI00244CB555